MKALMWPAIMVWLSALCAPAAAQPLKSYSIDPGHVFVAGVSAGAAMAVQLTVAYSATFKGAAIYAGPPYFCAGYDLLSVSRAADGCAAEVSHDNLLRLEEIARSWSEKGLIDPVADLRDKPIYLWSGRADRIVPQAVSNELAAFYHDFGASIFHYDNRFEAGHGWESPYGSVQCAETSPPYMNRCNDPSTHRPYDSEQVWFAQFFPTINPKNQTRLKGSLLSFSQNQFALGGSAASISMAADGYIFVPQSCAAGARCGLVLALHGCEQSSENMGKTFIREAGINQWADTNNAVVLYPQAAASISNPLGCWDWWGYLNDPNYAQKGGPQMRALYKMVLQVSGGAISAPHAGTAVDRWQPQHRNPA